MLVQVKATSTDITPKARYHPSQNCLIYLASSILAEKLMIFISAVFNLMGTAKCPQSNHLINFIENKVLN